MINSKWLANSYFYRGATKDVFNFINNWLGIDRSLKLNNWPVIVVVGPVIIVHGPVVVVDGLVTSTTAASVPKVSTPIATAITRCRSSTGLIGPLP